MQLFKIFSFVGDKNFSAQGSICYLYTHQQQPKSIHPENQSTSCISWLDLEQNLTVVKCFNHGKPIVCCGHGLLSAAYYWMSKQGVSKINLQMNGAQIQAYFEKDKVWLSFEPITTTQTAVPPWLAELIDNHQAMAAATAANDNGYLIIQWADNYPLESLSRPGKALAEFTQRALIYTAKHPAQTPAQSEVFIQFRYFAPQYGVDEDTATGSAMRVLIDYWATALKQPLSLTAIQVSVNKGLLMARLRDKKVEVGGYCSQIGVDVE